jgi:hypothetical protein
MEINLILPLRLIIEFASYQRVHPSEEIIVGDVNLSIALRRKGQSML